MWRHRTLDRSQQSHLIHDDLGPFSMQRSSTGFLHGNSQVPTISHISGLVAAEIAAWPANHTLTMCLASEDIHPSIHYGRTNPPIHTHDVTACYPSVMSVFQKDGTQFKTEIFPFQDASSPTDRVAKKGRADRDSERQSLCISFPSPTYCLTITLK